MTPTFPHPEAALEDSLPVHREIFQALEKAWKIRQEALL